MSGMASSNQVPALASSLPSSASSLTGTSAASSALISSVGIGTSKLDDLISGNGMHSFLLPPPPLLPGIHVAGLLSTTTAMSTLASTSPGLVSSCALATHLALASSTSSSASGSSQTSQPANNEMFPSHGPIGTSSVTFVTSASASPSSASSLASLVASSSLAALVDTGCLPASCLTTPGSLVCQPMASGRQQRSR
ncbi:unnamed protein product [Protopolystoma xenopodis]|uniref:Uncharacterized protein n=1 Tax=Protopolystoma xenopodis TaxID=117903 RepID=A0A3S5CGI2_9PLAT|nr:unnamed protein product [Protopolystoma xenopodis]